MKRTNRANKCTARFRCLFFKRQKSLCRVNGETINKNEMIDKDQQIKDLQAMLKAEQEKNGNLPSLQDKVNQLTRENADLRNKLNDLNREYREQSKALVTAVKIARHIQLYTPAE